MLKLRCLAFVFALAASAFSLSAQIGTSTMTGRVTDSSGAVVPNVTITIVQLATNFTFNAVANEEGIWRVPSLSPGAYRVTFEAAGFKKSVREGIDLRTGDTLAVDIVLQVGNVNESVQVTAEAPLLETETSATGVVADGEFLYKLPLYQRYVNTTLNLVPGMTQGGYAYGGDLGAYHLAGQRSGAIGIFEDGVNANDQGSGTGTIKPIQNAVEEVKVLTTVLPAEYGHSAGGVISVVKKSGTNELHGLASMYGRTRRMQHRLFFDRNRLSQPAPGAPNGLTSFFMLPDGNISGPVVIPKVYNGKNRTFFFFGYQKLIEKKNANDFGTVPTADMKNGDFSFGGIGNPIYDPATTRRDANGNWTRDPFPGNRIPVSRFDPVALKVLGLDPWASPNQPGTFNSAGPVGNFLYNEFSKTFFQDWSGKVDHQFNQNVKIYGSYTRNENEGLGRPRHIRIADFDANEGNVNPYAWQNASVGNTWVISPSLINDFRVGYYRRVNQKIVPSYGENWAQQLGIPNVSGELMPSFGIEGSGNQFSPESLYGISVSGPNRNVGETLSFRNDTTKVMGRHAFKFGYEYLQFRINNVTINRPSGDFRFDQMTAGLQPLPTGVPVPNTGNTFAGFLLGYVRQATFDVPLASWLPRSSVHSFYFQDDWKFSPTLTLNLGIRYSNESPFSTKYDQMTNFDPTIADPVTGRTGGFVHPTGALNRRDNNNFQPRIGLAWHPWSKWVFRGGFGVNTIDVKFPQSRGQFEEYNTNAVVARPPGDPTPAFRLSQGPGTINYPVRQDGTSPFTGADFSGRSAEWWDPNLRNPYVLNFNASIQYQLSSSYMLELSYQGSSGVGLIERWEANTFPIGFGAGNQDLLNQLAGAAAQNYRPYPHFGSIRQRSNFGHSTFHSGTVRLEKRYSKGLTFQTFYTWAKAINSQDNDNDGSGVAPIQNRGLEKARAGYDRNHRYVGSMTYELPFGYGKTWLNRGGWRNFIFGGYEIAWIQTFESGNPLTFTFQNSPFNYYNTFAGTRRPDLVSSPSLRDNWRDFGGDRFNQQNINPIVDINHFAYPAAFTVGNAGRNIMTGTPLIWSQASAQKNFRWGADGRYNVQLRWDFQNALKTYNFNNPTTNVDFRNPRTFGKVTSDPRTASFGGQPLMNLTLALRW
jgi:hypothetical protein